LNYSLEQTVENLREKLTTAELKDVFFGSARSFKFELPSGTECRKHKRKATKKSPHT
jgi:hypothetical protein